MTEQITLKHLEGELCRRSLHYFVQKAWHVLHPDIDFVDGKHIQAICLHLEALTDFRIKNLLIAIPPRHMKSELVSVFWPAWLWARSPSEQFLTASYAIDLAVRDNLAMRRLVSSDWYKQTMIETLHGGDTNKRWFVLSDDENRKEKFENTKFGSRQATSVESKATGFNATVIIVDDAHNASEYQSDTKLEAVRSWWKTTISNRKNDPKKFRRVVIGQMVSHRDLISLLNKTGAWTFLMLPAEFEPERKCKTSIGFEDWRTKPGELLWPERFGEEELLEIKKDYDFDKYVISAQLQQNPTPQEGGLFKKEWWQKWEGPMPDFEYIIQSWDTALEAKQENDYSCCTTWGIFQHKFVLGKEYGRWAGNEESRWCMMLLEVINERLEGPDLRERAIELAKQRHPDYIIIEQKASGHNLIQELRRARMPIVPFNPRTNDKVSRAHVAAILWKNLAVFYPDREWAKAAIEQTLHFPKGDHDDIVDSMVMAALWVRKRFWVSLAGEPSEDEEEERLLEKYDQERNVMRGFYD